MASKKKPNKTKQTTDAVPKGLENDILEAVSAENKPSKTISTSKIYVTHYEQDQADVEVVNVGTSRTESESTVEPEDEPVSDDVEEPNAATVEQARSEADADDEWHLIDDQDKSTTLKAEEAAGDEIEHDDEPEWDAEKWQTANIDEEEIERPDWDEEKWQKAEIEEDEREVERPEWDAEKWLARDADTEASKEVENEDKKPGVGRIAVDGSSDNIAVETSPELVDDSSTSSAGTSVGDRTKKSAVFSLRHRMSRFVGWWKQAKLRNSLATAAAFLLLIVAIPAPRNVAFNTVGVRATASIVVLDSETQLPLKAVKVILAGVEETTNNNGLAVFDNVKLGGQTLVIEKSAYEIITQNVTIGVGDNRLEAVELKSIGSSFNFEIVDWLTGEPIAGSEASYEQNSAFADDLGIARLSIPDQIDPVIPIEITAPDYEAKTVQIDNTETENTQVKLVVSRRHLFVSKRVGDYDVYKTLADGSGEEVVVEGTGNEASDLRFDVSPSGNKAILVASRDINETNDDGFVLRGLHLIDVSTGSIEKIDSSERIDLIGWIGETIMYVKVQAGASGRNPERHRLVGLNTVTGKLHEIAASNFFNDVLVAKNYVYYAPSDAYRQNPKPYLFRSNADGTAIDTVFEKNVWTIIRTGLNEIKFDADQTWYSGEIDRIFNTELGTRPTEFTSRLYTDSPTREKSAWVDIRDGKGALIIVDTATGSETTLTSQSGLRNPVTWLSDTHLVFRVVTSSETADYVINVNDDAPPVKITDVSDVSGADRWYYFY